MPAALTAERPRITRSTRVDSFRKDRLRSALIILWLLAVGALLVDGLDYYLTPLAERAASADHERMSPGGTQGRLLGVVGTILAVLGTLFYTLRRRFPGVARFGTLRSWLYVHIFLCSLGAALVLFHVGFALRGWMSLATTGVLLTVFSGVYGRFVYQWVPKNPHGRFLTLEEMSAKRIELKRELMQVSGCSAEQAAIWLGPPIDVNRPSPLRAVGLSLKYRLMRRARRSNLTRTLKDAGLKGKRNSESVRLILAENQLRVQAAFLKPFSEMMGRWRRFHVALVGLVALGVLTHVVLAVTGGGS